MRTIISLILAISAASAVAQTPADYQRLQKEVRELETKVSRLQRQRADTTVNYPAAAAPSQSPESRLLLNAGVTQLKLYGDFRLRYQSDQLHPEVQPATQITTDRNRFRYRLRIGADAQLGDQYFAGFSLATGQGADSNTVNFTGGYDNYNIYINKAFAGWKPNDWFTLIVGKQANPFYTTDLVWDPDINPQGAVEILDISKAFLPEKTPWSLQLISMQGAFFGNSNFSTGNDTAWQFVEQLKATYHFNKNTSLTIAPGFMTFTHASLSGLQNVEAFSKPNDVLPAALGVQTQTTTSDTRTETIKYDSTGKPSITYTPVNTTTTVTITDPSTGAIRTVSTETTNNQTQVTIPFGTKGNTLKQNKSLANQTFVSTKTLGGGTTTVTSPVGASPAAETRDLSIITAPGDFSFKIGGLSSKLYWDFAYNTAGGSRASREYFLNNHSSQDDLAWLVGLQVGENSRAGDWSIFANYRQVGLDSIDPNLNDNEFALGYLNVQGIKAGVAYNFTDSLIGAITWYKAWSLRDNLTGGEATAGAQLGNAKSVDVLQVDLNLKF